MKKRKQKYSFLNRVSKNWRRTPKLLKYTAITFFLLVISVGIYSITVQRARIAELSALPATPPSTSPFQYALKLDGQSYLRINNSESINPDINTGFTAEAWIKPANPIFLRMTIINKSNAYFNSYDLSTSSYYNQNEGKYYVTYIYGMGQSGCYSSRFVEANKVYSSPEQVVSWHHVVAVMQIGGKLDIIVDGQKLTNSNVIVTSNCVGDFPFQIGATVRGQTINHFSGELDEVHLANYAKYNKNFNLSYRPTTLAPSSAVLYRFDNDLANANRDSYFAIAHGTGYGFVPSTIAAPRPSPRTSCRPRPACLDARPACKIRETDDMCPRPTNLRVIPAPSSGRPRAY